MPDQTGAVGPLTADRIIGWRGDPAMADPLHRLAHHGAVDRLVVPEADLGRRRFQAVTEAGRAIQVALPRDQRLADGAVLVLRAELAVVVTVGAPEWLALIPNTAADALQLGYAAGNLHWRVRFDGDRLLVALDAGGADGYLARLEALSGRFTVSRP